MDNIDLAVIVNDIRHEVEDRFERLGLFYRIFARGKTTKSIEHKLSIKDYNDEKKMQDIVGVRIVLYFIDDVGVVYELLKSMSNFIGESNSEKEIIELDKTENLSIGKLSDKIFMPQRLNLVFKMNQAQTNNLSMALSAYPNSNLIDNTYEVQIRTIFSEGWHEVEHDLRYKCKDEKMWDYCREESRTLNGIYASLETTETSMRSLFDNIAYKNFKKKDWSAMLRNKLCIRFDDNDLSKNICNILDVNESRLGKEIFKFPRAEVFDLLKGLPGRMPRKMDNIVFLLNRATINNQEIRNLEPTPISDLLDSLPIKQ
jgi:ppGpp synthetase/RelA/SpoT-type nucleotidyltranferase